MSTETHSATPLESQSQAATHQRVSAILVSHNGSRWLPEVVAALSSQERPPDFLFAVDTGSTDGSAELLRNSRIEVLDGSADSGFGEAIALAVSQLPLPQVILDENGAQTQREVEWLWLLHDDCAPAPDALAQLLAAVSERPNVGVAGPKILGWHDRNHLLEIGVTIAHNGARWTGLERNERDQGQHDGDGVLPVLAVSTAGALVRRDLFEEIGGFDENLPLFRDDVDFGMRAHMAGFSVLCVTTAKLFHAEAAATERRTVDVAGGSFHRPHLLDRRHAAFVLLANLPLWTLPWITLRIFLSSILRAIGYLLVKLPGYALDEIAAVALLFTRLDKLRVARRARRKKRLLPARVIRPLLAPWSEQLKLGSLRVRDVLLRRSERMPEPVLGSVFSESDGAESYEEILAPVQTGFWRQTFTRPLVLVTLPLLLISFLASRSRFGPLAGGALAQLGDSAFAYFEFYSQSWHALGLGSGKIAHPFTPLLALLSLITGANPALFVTLLFLFAPLISLFTMYLFLRKSGSGRIVSIIAGLLYASTALMITSINSGMLSTVVLIITLPLVALIAAPFFSGNLAEVTWRRTCVVAILLAISSAISFQIFIATLLSFIAHLIYLSRNKAERTLVVRRALMYVVIISGAFFALAPWSIANLVNPGQLLIDQGVPAPISGPLSALAGNFHPFSQSPVYIVSATLVIALVALFSKNSFIESVVILSAISLAALTSAVALPAAGNSLSQHIWPGGFLAISSLFASRALAKLGAGRIERLRASSFGRAHLAAIALAFFTAYCIGTNLFWFVSSSSSAQVKSVSNSVLPPYISTATDNPDRPKTLILRSRQSQFAGQGAQSFSYIVLRESDVRFGELNAVPDEMPILTKTVGEITAGGGDAPAAKLAEFGIKYLYLENGKGNTSLARKIDGVGGLSRLSATSEGILWEVSGITSRIRYLSNEADAAVVEVPAEKVGAEFDVATSGTVSISELFDSRWRLLHGGKVLKPEKSQSDLLQFSIPEAGRAVLFHDGTMLRAGISLQLAVLGLLLFFALPRGRKQSELRDEEVS